MRNLFSLFFCICVLCAALGQVYKPKAGETAIKLEIKGRGDVYIKLYTLEAPKTTAHIIKLVKDGFYNNQRFHRVDKSPKPYLVQVGDPTSKDGNLDDASIGTHDSGTPVPFEDTGHQNVEGAVGLAHSVENRDSGDSQFYMLLGTSKFLDGNYTVFGQVVGGMDVVKKIERGDRITTASIIGG